MQNVKTKTILQAYIIGLETFKNGGSIIPAQSKELMQLLKDHNIQVGQGVEVMNAFQQGFIDSPVEAD